MKFQKAWAKKLLHLMSVLIYLIRIPKLHIILPNLVEKLMAVFGDDISDNFVDSPLKFKFHIDDNFSLQTALTSCERSTLRILLVLSKRTNFFINVGANYGFYVLAIKRSNVNKRVIAFEPQNRNFLKLKCNVEKNNLSIEINKVAVADYSNLKRELYKYRDGNPGMFTLSPLCEREFVLDSFVETVSLDEYFKLEIPKSLILMDIEGSEVLALKGARSALKSRSIFVCEVNSLMLTASNSSSSELFKIFIDFDYVIYWINEKGKLVLQSHDCPPVHEEILGRGNGANYLFLPLEDCESLEKESNKSQRFFYGIRSLFKIE